MAMNRTAGTKPLGTEISAELRDYLDRYKKLRGETIRVIIERALRREFAGPPPIPSPPPLPPLPPTPAESPRKKK